MIGDYIDIFPERKQKILPMSALQVNSNNSYAGSNSAKISGKRKMPQYSIIEANYDNLTLASHLHTIWQYLQK